VINNEHDDDTQAPTTDRTFTPVQQRDARRLLADLRAWAETLRDATPPGLLFAFSSSERLTMHAWGQFEATAKRLERLVDGEPETHDDEGGEQ